MKFPTHRPEVDCDAEMVGFYAQLRIQALVLLRRFAFRSISLSEPSHPTYAPKEAWDELSIPAQTAVLQSLLGLLVAAGEPGRMRETERRTVADTIGEMGKQSLNRGRECRLFLPALVCG